MCGEWIEGSEGNNKGLGENCGETCRVLVMEVEVTSNSDLILETDNFLAQQIKAKQTKIVKGHAKPECRLSINS